MRAAMVLVLLSACVRKPEASIAEFCGARGMVLSGTTTTTSDDRGAAFVNGTIVPVASESSSESVSCRPPASQKDQCELRASRASTAWKDSFSITGRNLATGVGWAAFIVPGLVLYIVFNGQSDDAGREADIVFEQTYTDCMKTVP